MLSALVISDNKLALKAAGIKHIQELRTPGNTVTIAQFEDDTFAISAETDTGVLAGSPISKSIFLALKGALAAFPV